MRAWWCRTCRRWVDTYPDWHTHDGEPVGGLIDDLRSAIRVLGAAYDESVLDELVPLPETLLDGQDIDDLFARGFLATSEIGDTGEYAAYMTTEGRDFVRRVLVQRQEPDDRRS